MKNYFYKQDEIKLTKAHLSKIIKLGQFLGNMMCTLTKKAPMNLVTPFGKDVFPKLVSKFFECNFK